MAHLEYAIMIDGLFEPASNWLVIVLILWVLAYIYSKEFADAKRFKFIADAFNVEIEQAVKWFIILIVVVFDPLAICLVIGYNMYVVTQQLNEKMAKIPPREPVPTRVNNKNKRVIVLGRNKS